MEKVICPNCGSEYLVKNGNQNGLQGYKCKECKKKFSFGKYEQKNKNNEVKKEKKNSYNKLFDLGHEWEKIVEKILKQQGKKIESQKMVDNNKIVDFIYDRTIIECKLSAGTEELLETIKKYSDYCDKLEIWSLNKYSQERVSTHISKEIILEKMERKIGRWHDCIEEFKQKNINVDMLYYDDIIKKIEEPNILKELNDLYDKYKSIQPHGGRVISYKDKLEICYEPFLKDINTELNINEKIYVNNAIKKHLYYNIKNKDSSDDSFNKNWQIKGTIILKDLKKFKIPDSYYSSNAREDYRNCSFLELEFKYTNKNKFENYETIFSKFHLIDDDGMIYENIPGYDIDNLIIRNCNTTGIQRHIEPMQPNKIISGKMYFKIPDNLEIKEFVLGVGENGETDIELDNQSSINRENNNISYNKIENKSKNRNVIVIVLTLIFILILFLLCINKFNNNSDNNIIKEKSEEELTYETAQNYIIQENYIKALNELEKIQEYKDSLEIISKINYLIGVKKYDEGNINNALIYFNKIPNYKDSQDYIKKCDVTKKLIGTYRNGNKYIMINYEDILYITMNNGYTEQLSYKIDFSKNVINITTEEIKIDFNEKSSTLIYENRTYNKESDYIDTSKIKYYAPRLGMTQEEVLNTSWGKPQYVDYGGTAVDKNNKKRTNGEWDESWYYKRNNNQIFIDFKNGKVIKFNVTLKGELSSKELSNVDRL